MIHRTWFVGHTTGYEFVVTAGLCGDILFRFRGGDAKALCEHIARLHNKSLLVCWWGRGK